MSEHIGGAVAAAERHMPLRCSWPASCPRLLACFLPSLTVGTEIRSPGSWSRRYGGGRLTFVPLDVAAAGAGAGALSSSAGRRARGGAGSPR